MGKRGILFIALLLLHSAEIFGQITLPRLISDGMVLQRDAEVRVWGRASAGEEVKLTFDGETHHATADEGGDWEILLPPRKAGGPYEMAFEASNRVVVQDILFGDVWIASGQSNMELTMERVKETYAGIVQSADNRNIRQFEVPDSYDFNKKHSDLDGGSWQSVAPQSIYDFSAVAYFFARELHKQYDVPIGIINAALGGSPVEAWMSEEALKEFPAAYNELQKFKDNSLIARIEQRDRERMEAWYKELNRKDRGLTSEPDWTRPDADDSDWPTMDIPGYWADEAIGDVNGVVWFRKELTIPESMAGRKASLWVGRIVDQDYVYVNGELTGTTGYQYPPRRYTVDAGLLKEGKNVLAVRVINSSGKGGFIPDKPYYLAVGRDTIDLKGPWKYKLGTEMSPLESQTFIRWKPAGLYNKMIHPLHNYAIKGVIWYQGESNTDNPAQYAETFPAMIKDWRANWNQGEFPFLYVQLANFMETTEVPVESNWAELRQAQLETLSIPHTGMAVTIDLGEWNDIHPLNKQDVGKRLALLARNIAYGETDVPAFSPAPAGAEFNENAVVIKFDHIGSGLISSDGEPLRHFAVSGDGETFVRAKAVIEGKAVKVWNEAIANPVAVRYAWADNPDAVNLYTKDGLPASPFEIRKDKPAVDMAPEP